MTRKLKKLFSTLPNDIPASIVVFLIALPLSMGIALGSGAPLFSGLIGGIVGGIVIGAISKSSVSVSGPAAGLTAIVLTGILKLNSFELFLTAVVLSGIFQIILGAFKAGNIGEFVPANVIKGMLAAIGIILILNQIPYLTGFNAEASEAAGSGTSLFLSTDAWKYILPTAVAIGVLSILIQLLWDKVLLKKYKTFMLIPSALVVVLAAVLINELLRAFYPALAVPAEQLVNIPVASSPEEFASFFMFPDFSGISNYMVWTTAITLALVGSLETLLNIEAADEMDPRKNITPKNRELTAQGVGNMVSGLIGGLPLTSVIVRTSANIHAGAKSRLSAIFHGVLLLVSVIFIPAYLNHIPLAALAGILIYTGYKLASVHLFKDMFKRGLHQFIPFAITIVSILLTDLLVGILIGCVTGLFYVMRSNFKSAVLVVNDDNNYLIRLRKDISFLNKPILKSKFAEIPQNSYVLIDATRADYIDANIIETIEDFLKNAHHRNIKVEVRKSNFRDHGFNGITEKYAIPSPTLKTEQYASI